MSSSTSDAAKQPVQQQALKDEFKPSNLALGLGICMVAISAGMTLYVKRSGSILNRIYDVQQNEIRRGGLKVGPITKKEWKDSKPMW
jgi:hypothetical protein